MHSHVLWFIELLASSLDYTVLPKVNVKYCCTVAFYVPPDCTWPCDGCDRQDTGILGLTTFPHSTGDGMQLESRDLH